MPVSEDASPHSLVIHLCYVFGSFGFPTVAATGKILYSQK